MRFSVYSESQDMHVAGHPLIVPTGPGEPVIPCGPTAPVIPAGPPVPIENPDPPANIPLPGFIYCHNKCRESISIAKVVVPPKPAPKKNNGIPGVPWWGGSVSAIRLPITHIIAPSAQ